jgi:hypothetical protein
MHNNEITFMNLDSQNGPQNSFWTRTTAITRRKTNQYEVIFHPKSHEINACEGLFVYL